MVKRLVCNARNPAVADAREPLLPDGRKRWKIVLADQSILSHDRVMKEGRQPHSPEPRHVAILLYEGVQSLDVAGPLEVFTAARELIAADARHEPAYEVRTYSRDGAPVNTSSGLTLTPNAGLGEVPARLDTLLVPGGHGSRQAIVDEQLVQWIGATASGARRTAAVCTGAFLLAKAGLLDGRRATTHWVSAERLASAFPAVHVDPDPIFLRDGNIWTSAGVTAGMDLSLALVEEDLDRDTALVIARHLVLFLRRPGNQSQFSATLVAQQPRREPLREAQRAVIENVGGDHSVEAMATRAHMSPRHFARAFAAETGVTPARYVERVRLEAARRLLEDTGDPIATVAAQCGFGTAETMRRVFLRTLEVGPAEYRRRFHALAPTRASRGGAERTGARTHHGPSQRTPISIKKKERQT
jgi:transcriptional regulator GlxA family with amidase domain